MIPRRRTPVPEGRLTYERSPQKLRTLLSEKPRSRHSEPMLVIAIGNLIAYALSVIDPSRVVYRFLLLPVQNSARADLAAFYLCVHISARCLRQLSLPRRHQSVLLLSVRARDGARKLIRGVCRRQSLLSHRCPAVRPCRSASRLQRQFDRPEPQPVPRRVQTLAPETRMLLMTFMPHQDQYLAWVDLAFTAVNVVFLLLAGPLSFYWLMPLVPLANYFLFFGSDVQNLFPNSWRYRRPSSTTPVPMPRSSPTPIGQRVTSRKPVSGLTATSAPSAANPHRLSEP